MSKIIRGIQADQLKTHTVEIQLRDMFVPTSLTENMEEERPLSLDDVLQERNRLLEEARAQIQLEREQFDAYQQSQLQAIDQLKVTWEEERPLLEQQAYDEAFSKGYDEGMQKAAAQMNDSIQEVNELMKIAQINADKYIMDQENTILDLSLKCAEKIIGLQLAENEDTYISIIKRGLKEVREQNHIKVYVDYERYPLISQYRDELAQMFPPDVQFLIFVHEDLQTNECYIETNHGRVVVSIDEQLQELRMKLSEILESKD